MISGISRRINELRKELDLSMPKFGRRLGCSRDVIANLEYGRVEPKEVFLDHICDIFGVRREWLFYGRGEMFENELPPEKDEQAREALRLFSSLSPELRELALKQLRDMSRVMEESRSREANRRREKGLETIELMGALLRADSFEDVPVDEMYGELSLSRHLMKILNDMNMEPGEAEKRACLKEGTVSGIVDGSQRPIRDTLLALAVALSLGSEQTQRLLARAGMNTLYAQSRRDAAVIFALMRELPLTELHELLESLEEPPLIGVELP